MMAILSLFLLLAACFSTVTPGPVPRRQLFTSYANTTSDAFSTIETPRPSSVALDSSLGFSSLTDSLIPLSSTRVLSLPTPTSSFVAGNWVNADTAVIIEPVQPTVIEHTIPAITYLNPNGEPLATQEIEIVSSTSFITPSSSTLKSEYISSASPVLSYVSERLSTTSSDESKTRTSSSAGFVPTLSSSLANAESDSPSSSSFKPPTFTYSPEEDETSTSLASSMVSTTTKTSNSPTASATTSALASSAIPSSSATSTTGTSLVLSSTGLPGFSFNATGSRGADIPNISTYVSVIQSSSATQSAVKSSSLPVFESSGVLTTPVVTDRYTASAPPGVANSTTKTGVAVTTTQYTTVFPSPSASNPASSVPTLSSVAHITSSVSTTSSLIQEVISSLLLTSTTGATFTTSTLSQNIIPPSSTVATLPSTPLVPPPVVIVTQYTTTTPPATPLPSNISQTSSTSALPELTSALSKSSSVYTISSSSAVGLPIPAPTPSTPASELVPSSNISSISTQPSSTGYTPPAVATSEVAPITTETPSTPSPSPVPAISTTEGPLIITPIPPSQIFTITVTEKDNETVTETATVTVTA